MFLFSSLALLVFSQMRHVTGNGIGAPKEACVSMMPEHYSSEQPTEIPCTLTTSTNIYDTGDTLTQNIVGMSNRLDPDETPSYSAATGSKLFPKILSECQTDWILMRRRVSRCLIWIQTVCKVTLNASSGYFKGFLIQARDADDQAVGTMIADSATSKTLDCGATANALTHNGPTVKTAMTFQWQAPDVSTGDITFYVTVVKSYVEFWAAKTMLTLYPDTGAASTNTPLPQTSTTVSPPLTTTLTAQSSPLIPQEGTSSKPPAPSTSTEKEETPTLSPTGGGPRKLSVKGGNILYDDACGSSKGCFVNCNGKECKYMITWRDVGMAVQFELYGQPGYQSAWIAVGFSTDTKMGGDSVTECVANNGMVQIFNSENINFSNRRLNPAQAGLSNMYGSYNDGVLYCTFTRQKFVPGIPQMFNLDQDWNIMFANGENLAIQPWNINKHRELPPVSASSVDYQSFAVIGSAAKYTLVKAHGCLMILSWVLFNGVGIVAARYYKNVWSEKSFLKLKIWFQIHRACMVSALVFDVVAFVIIFIDVGGYSEIDVPGKKYLSSHPVLGIIITGLCLINPIMALFRPGPDDSKRPIFNWAHWGVGMTAYILSAICICFGFQLGKSSTPDYAVYIMIVYIMHIIIFDVIFELLECMMKKQKKGKVDSVEMTAQNGTDTPVANGHYQTKEIRKSQDRIKTVLLAIHVAFTGAFALVLVLVVALN